MWLMAVVGVNNADVDHYKTLTSVSSHFYCPFIIMYQTCGSTGLMSLVCLNMWSLQSGVGNQFSAPIPTAPILEMLPEWVSVRALAYLVSPAFCALTAPPCLSNQANCPSPHPLQVTRMELWPGAWMVVLLLFLLLLFVLPTLWFCSPSAKYFFKIAFYNGWILFLAVLAIPVCAVRGRNVENMKWEPRGAG